LQRTFHFGALPSNRCFQKIEILMSTQMRNMTSKIAIAAATAIGGYVLLIERLPAQAGDELARPTHFESIPDEQKRAIAIFTEMGKVIQHPRCLNCHPQTDRPSQGDGQHPHMPPVQRGPDGLGKAAMACTTCHGEDNFSFGG